MSCPMLNEEMIDIDIAILSERIDEQANNYYDYKAAGNEEKSFEIGQLIWTDMWNLRNYIFNHHALSNFRTMYPSALYTEKDEFLLEAFYDTLPDALKKYTPARKSFRLYFIYKLRNSVLNKLRDIYGCRYQIKIKSENVKILELNKTATDINGKVWIVSEQKLRTDTRYNVTKTIVGEDGTSIWYEIEIASHGKRYRIQENDVLLYKNEDALSLEEICENGEYAEPKMSEYTYINIGDVIDVYALNLLALAQKLYGEKTAIVSGTSSGRLTKYHVYKMLYTEKLIEKLKAFYDYIIGQNNLVYKHVNHESEVISATMKELIDYLLKYKNCVTFTEIMRCPLRRYRDFSYLEDSREEYVEFPLLQEILIHFIIDEMKINRDPNGLKVSISRGRREFNDQLKAFEAQAHRQTCELLN